MSLDSNESESESCLVMSDSLQPHGLYSPFNSPGQNTEVGSLSLLQGIFPTQGSNQGLLHCRWILYQLSYQGSPLYSLIPLYYPPLSLSLIITTSSLYLLVCFLFRYIHKFAIFFRFHIKVISYSICLF